jgi:hypothetical protein
VSKQKNFFEENAASPVFLNIKEILPSPLASSIGLLDSPLYSGNILSMYMYLNTAAILFQHTRLLKDLKNMALGCLELTMGEPKTYSSCSVKM